MPSDGSDFIFSDYGSYQAIDELKNSYAGGAAPGDPATGVQFFNTGNNKFSFYDGSIWRTIVQITNKGILPEGSIIAWQGGYYQDGSNGTYTRVLGADNTVAAVNTLFNTQGWYVCNGAALNLSTSTIFDGAGRYLPNLSDDRFIQGDNIAAGSGGESSNSHTHDWDIAQFSSGTPSATETILHDTPDVGFSDPDHTHFVNPPSTTSEIASSIINRPKWLACFYIMRAR